MEVTEDFLREVGLAAMPEEEKKAFIEYVQEELEVRVGEEIAEGMTEEKMKEFSATTTNEEAEKWLNENKPNFRGIVDKTIKELKDEISRNKERIL